MLFTYPVEALACNWLNDNIITSLVDGMTAIDGGGTPLAWPNCLPGATRENLRRHTAFGPDSQLSGQRMPI
jgi:hypothetical protein